MSLAASRDDEDYITQCLTAGESGSKPLPLPSCRWCTCKQHGLPCNTSGCNCESTYSSRDDSWRAHDFTWTTDSMKARRYADAHGVDGWIARMACMPGTSWASSPASARRIKDALNGTTSPVALSSSQGVLT